MKKFIFTLLSVILLFHWQIVSAQPITRTVIILGIHDHKDFERDFLEGVPLSMLDIEYSLRDMLVLDPQYAINLAEYDQDIKADYDLMLKLINDPSNKQSFSVKINKKKSDNWNLINLLGNGVRTDIMRKILGDDGDLTTILSPVSLKDNEAIIHVEGYKRKKGFAKYHIKLVGNQLEYTEIINNIDLSKEKTTALDNNQYGLGIRAGIGLAGTGINLISDYPKFNQYSNNVSFKVGLVYNLGINGGSILKPNRCFFKFALYYSHLQSKVTKNFGDPAKIDTLSLHSLLPRVGLGYRFSIGNKNSIDMGMFLQYNIEVLNPAFKPEYFETGIFINATIKKIHVGIQYNPTSLDGLSFNVGYNFGNFKK